MKTGEREIEVVGDVDGYVRGDSRLSEILPNLPPDSSIEELVSLIQKLPHGLAADVLRALGDADGSRC